MTKSRTIITVAFIFYMVSASNAIATYTYFDICTMPIYIEIGTDGESVGFCYTDCEDIEVRANFPAIFAFRIDEVYKEFENWNIYWKDDINQISGSTGDWEKLTLCVEAHNQKEILGGVPGDKVLVGMATVSVKPPDDGGGGGWGMGYYVELKDCSTKEVKLKKFDCGCGTINIDICTMPIYLVGGSYVVGYCYTGCEDFEVRANFPATFALRIDAVYCEFENWNIYWKDDIHQISGVGAWENLTLCVEAHEQKDILGNWPWEKILVGMATVSVTKPVGSGVAGSFVELKDCNTKEVELKQIACDCATINMEIDIYPNRVPNRVILSRNYTLYVAMLGSADFDVTNMDSSSVLFGRTGTEASPVRAPIMRDLNGDGFADAMYGFMTNDCGFQLGDTEGWLTGFTTNGTPVEGSDSVLVSP